MKKFIPINIFRIAIQCLPRYLKKSFFYGTSHYCTLCESNLRRFWKFGFMPRPNALCPVCRSLERHRLDWFFLQHKTNLLDKTHKRMLHVAPEKSFETLFKKISGLDYLSADLNNPKAMVKMDITDIQFPDNTFDIIYCSHVLEHIIDDHKAMTELFRVLKPNGWALLQVPILAGNTYEDSSIQTAENRLKYFGHPEHVRNYGYDYPKRLTQAGFTVSVTTSTEVFRDKKLFRFGITKNQRIFYATKE